MKKKVFSSIAIMLVSGLCFAGEEILTQLAKEEDILEGTEKPVEMSYGIKQIRIRDSSSRYIPLTYDRPDAVKGEPKYLSKKPLYGTIRLGNTPDYKIPICVDRIEKGAVITFYIYIDTDMDGDLSNEAPLIQMLDTEKRCYSHQNFSTQVDYLIDGETVKKNLDYSGYVREDNAFALKTRWLCSGMLEIKGEPRLIKVFDKNNDGLFDGNDILLVDINGDGEIDSSRYTNEQMKLSEPFKIGDRTYLVKAVRHDGEKLIIGRTTKEAKTPERIGVGSQAPSFSRLDILSRKVLSPQWFKGQPVLLSFAPYHDTEEAAAFVEEIVKRSQKKDMKFVLIAHPWSLDTILRNIGEGEKEFYLVLNDTDREKSLREQFLLDDKDYHILLDSDGKICLKEKGSGIAVFWKIIGELEKL